MDNVVTPVTGNDLRMLRLARAGVSAAAVAREAGWSRSRVSAIECTQRPTRRAAIRYLAALERADAAR